MKEMARELMSRPRARYLWTDAFAVCNHLDLDETEKALELVDEVHRILAHDRSNRWLKGASAEHPTLGGLRIGKKLPERPPGERIDERLEWDRDGQYFHYLTRWMHALDRVSKATGQTRYNLWARELADTAYRAFVGPGDRLVWKMSVDLTRPLVNSMGQHDPLDGFVTFTELRTTARERGWLGQGPCLEEATQQLEKMSRMVEWTTTDSLGLGCLLMDSMRVAGPVRQEMQAAALQGLRGRQHRGEALAFRELGLAIGIRVARLERYLQLADEIEKFWLEPWNRTPLWNEHRDINEVMLATLLLKGGVSGEAKPP